MTISRDSLTTEAAAGRRAGRPRKSRHLREHLVFLKAAATAPGQTGSLIPSSPALARAMVADLPPTGRIVEIGPGTGSVTRLIPHHRDYLGIEASETFGSYLRGHFPQRRFMVRRVEDAVAEAADFLGEGGTILCGLPFSTIPEPARLAIFGALAELESRTILFRTFQYYQSWWMSGSRRARRQLSRIYGHCPCRRAVVANFPPAVVLSWACR